jgi:hypothetical protein
VFPTLSYLPDRDLNFDRRLHGTHLRKRKTEARDLQDPEPLRPDLRGYPRRLEEIVLSSYSRSLGGKGDRTSVSLTYLQFVSDDSKWEIKPLGVGYTIRRVSVPMSFAVISAILR